jgi:dipeptidyl aminopeptidase/acylaminoacyl peptidase
MTHRLLLLLTLASLTARAQWTPDDVVNAESATSFDLSPDGKTAVWAKRTAHKEKDAFVSKLFLTRLDQREAGKPVTIQLTRGDDADRNPLFSRDGKLIYFLSARDKGKKIWAINPAGGEAYEVKTLEVNPSNPHWLNDSTLVFVAEEGKTLYEKEAEDRKDDVQVIEDTAHFKPSRLFTLNVKSKDLRRLSDNRFPVAVYAVSRDGNWIVSAHTRSPHFGADGKPRPEIRLWDVRAGTSRGIISEQYGAGQFLFAHDNAGFYFTINQTSDTLWSGAGVRMLRYYDLASGRVSPVPVGHEWGLGGGLMRTANGVIVELANGPTNKLAVVERKPGPLAWTVKPLAVPASMGEHVAPLVLSKDHGTMLYEYSTASVPTQYHVGKLTTDTKKGTVSLGTDGEFITLNAGFPKKKIAKSEVMRWKGWRDDEVTGILYYPTNYQPGRAYPLVVSIHGGPSAADGDAWGESWAYFPNILAQKGAFVLMPNYHGSSNHGQAFVESIAKNYYEPELEDITKGIDALVAKGLVTRDSLGVQGWSNGAILTTMLTVRYPDLFKVAAPGAGDVNWTSDFGTCQFGVTFDQHYFGGAPWDNVGGKTYNEAYITKSPLFELERVKTPTIIFHGSEDRAVPRDQGWEYYRALQQIGQAPVRFLWFPGQPHGLQKVTHQLRKMNEEIAWFDKYLFGKKDTLNEAFKKDSPLAMLLEKDKAARLSNGSFGVTVGQDKMGYAVLGPEVVSLGKDTIAVGRFEVTRAQMNDFINNQQSANSDATRPLLVGEAANLPVTPSYEQAFAYCQWLTEKTGKKHRLPNAREARELAKKAREVAAKENTLNHWAGYALTLDEVPTLKQKLSGLKTTLLKPVGSFAASKVGEADLYDLGGNVAEWYTKDDGTPGTYGHSAYDFADPTNETPKTDRAHVGFRVVQEK